MNTLNKKKSVLSLIMVFAMMILMVFPGTVLADDAPPAEEPAQEETAAPQITEGEGLPDPLVTVEPEEENLAEIIEVLNEADLVVVDQSGESLSFASEETIHTLTLADPWYEYNGTTYRFFYPPNPGDPDPCATYPAGTCFTSVTPITASLTDAKNRINPIDDTDRPTIYLDGIYTENISIIIPVWLEGMPGATLNGDIDINADWVTINNLTINGSVSAIVTGAEHTAGDDGYQNVVISNNTIQATGKDAGVLVGQDFSPIRVNDYNPYPLFGGQQKDFVGLTIYNNIIQDANIAGVLIKGATSSGNNLLVAANHISLSGTYPQLGVGGYDPAKPWDSRGEGIWVDSSSYTTLLGNILEYNSLGGIWVSSIAGGIYGSSNDPYAHHISILANIIRHNDLALWITDAQNSTLNIQNNNIHENWNILVPGGQYLPFSNYTGANIKAYGTFRAGGVLQSAGSWSWLEDLNYDGPQRTEWCIRSDYFDDGDHDGFMNPIDSHSDPDCLVRFPHIHPVVDNCPEIFNLDQSDTDLDGIGDVCDPTPTGDSDQDGVDNSWDNCPEIFNPDQLDSDNDGIGDVCDPTPTVPPTDDPADEPGGVQPVIVLPLDLIPVTGGEKIEIPCTSECITFTLPNGSEVEFCGLCEYSMSISEETEDTLPFDKPEGVSMLLGMTINLFDLNGIMVTDLPAGASLTIGFPMGDKGKDLLGIQLWDPAKEEWVLLIDALATEGQLQAKIDWPGTAILVE